MKELVQVLLILHIGAGFLSLLVAPIALAVKKGGSAHRQWGKIFVGGMTIVALTALPLATIRYNPFLLLVSIFSYYFVISGYRALYLKQLHLDQRPTWVDWLIFLVTVIFSLGLLVWGSWEVLTNRNGFGWVAIVFAIIGIISPTIQFRKFYHRPSDKMDWWYSHLIGMIGGYIATVSAFSATNLMFLPVVFRWLWPTLLGVPLMLWWVRYYRKRFFRSQV